MWLPRQSGPNKLHRAGLMGLAYEGAIILVRGIFGVLCTLSHEASSSVHKKPCRIGLGQSEGSKPSRLESSDPMIEADAPSTGELPQCCPECARPTGDSHGRTYDDHAQRFKGTKRRPR